VDPPSARANASFTAHPLNPSELILFGGEFYNGKKCLFNNDLYRYNIDKKEWRKISSPNSPGPRSSHQAVATPSGLLFVFGGTKHYFYLILISLKASLRRHLRGSSFTTEIFGCWTSRQTPGKN